MKENIYDLDDDMSNQLIDMLNSYAIDDLNLALNILENINLSNPLNNKYINHIVGQSLYAYLDWNEQNIESFKIKHIAIEHNEWWEIHKREITKKKNKITKINLLD
jgi:hypothetical protein